MTTAADAPPLAGKVLVIIGGTSGIGISAARACMAAGARLSIVGLEPTAGLAEEFGERAVVQFADATQPGTAEAAVGAAVDKFGRLDGLYHVAGGSGRPQGDGPLHGLTDEGWEYTLRLNATSAMFSARAAAQHFLASGIGGSVLLLSSVLAQSPSPKLFGTVGYACAKAAVEGLVMSCASAYAANGIRFNAIAPGLVATAMSLRAQSNPEIIRFAASKQPLGGGGIGAPEHLDAAAVFLLSDASRWVTGQVLAVDGGWSVIDSA